MPVSRPDECQKDVSNLYIVHRNIILFFLRFFSKFRSSFKTKFHGLVLTAVRLSTPSREAKNYSKVKGIVEAISADDDAIWS